ncbi:MAG: SDR family NAD(P)-dependent oxidoreductase [Methyloligellaceae bacterium]
MPQKRLEGKTAIIVGAGQQPGETMGNGRAAAIRFAQEGATVLLVDCDAESAEETLRAVEKEDGTGSVLQADITNEEDCRKIASTCVERYGRIDVLHNNVGRSRGDKPTPELDAAMWDELMALNLKGMFMTCKHVLPVMREQNSGAIINISSTASTCTSPTLAYKTGKGAVNTMTQHMAFENAPHGVRVNAILPGYMDTPMAIERRAKERGVDREVIRKERDERVPLLKRQGTAWDVANAALFLASDEAQYITGVLLLVDGGRNVNVG